MRIRFHTLVFRSLCWAVVGTALLFAMSLWMSSEIISKPNCVRSNNVVFLKTHKTGSCTIQNIFFRYGYERNLIFALPIKNMFAGYPKHFLPEHVIPLIDSSMEYNIFCFHARFNYSSFQKIMPDDTKYVTVLRQPVPMFESLYNYFHMGNGFNITLEQLMQYPEDSPIFKFRWSGMLGINQMSFDLGLSYEQFRNPKLIMDFVSKLDEQFHLVMISELMDESLVLLMHTLCWDVDDVIGFSHNVRIEELKVSLSEKLKENISIINGADEFLYSYFRQKLEQTIMEFGLSRMESEVAILRSRRQMYKDNCIESEATRQNISDKQLRPIVDTVIGFNLKGNDEVCVNLARAEWPYIAKLKDEYQERNIVNWKLGPKKSR